MTRTPEEGRALALTPARHTIDSLIDAARVVAIEFRTIAAANGYWRG
ncbi:hexameric tyrosine-coordinated heme protein [Streptomyces sp. XH2]